MCALQENFSSAILFAACNKFCAQLVIGKQTLNSSCECGIVACGHQEAAFLVVHRLVGAGYVGGDYRDTCRKAGECGVRQAFVA